jgi:hypothetical protein
MTDETITARLEELRAAIHAENISYGELHELQGYGEQGHIPEGDVELREWAGLPEFPDDPLAGPWTIDADGVSVLNRHGVIVNASGSPEEAHEWIAEHS